MNLDKYVEKVKEFIDNNPGISEELIVRNVYLDLGKKFSFNLNFLPFGNSKKKQEIYRLANYPSELEKCMENNTIICNSLSRILVYILSRVGINIRTVVEDDSCYPTKRHNPHMYNIVIPKNGEPYSIDLQRDICQIKMHSTTPDFGLSIDKIDTYVISKYEQELLDRKLGYISDDNYYLDYYYRDLKDDASYIEDFREKVRFILENIEVYETNDIGYIDRQWYHVGVLKNIFNVLDFDYDNSRGKIRFIDCYKDHDGIKQYVSVVVVDANPEPDIYIYNAKEKKYSKIDFVNFAYAVKNGLVLHNAKVRNLNKVLSQLEKKQILVKKMGKQ